MDRKQTRRIGTCLCVLLVVACALPVRTPAEPVCYFLHDGRVYRVDIAERSIAPAGSLHRTAVEVTVAPDGLVWGRGSLTAIAALDPATGESVATIELPDRPYAQIITPAGRLYAAHNTLTREGFSMSVVDQTFKTTAGGKVFDPIRLDTYHYGYRSYDVYCWFDVGPDEGVLDDGDHSVWRHLVDITVGEDTDVELEHQVLTGFILWDLTELYYLTPEGENPPVPEREYWHEFHVWVALVVPVMELDSGGAIVDLDFIDLEEAGVLDDNTSYLGFAYRRALHPLSWEASWGQIRYALDITGLKEILDDAGGNPDCDDLPYNPCYLLAFMEPELVPGEEGALSDGDVYGYYGYQGHVIPIPPPWGLNVYLDGGGLSGYDIGLTERMWP